MLSNRVDELLSVWEARCEAGQSVSAEELCAHDPDLLPEVRWAIHALEQVESQFGVPVSRNEHDAGPSPSGPHLRSNQVDVRSRYDIERLYASGGLGRVFIANDRQLNRRVAIKFPLNLSLSAEARVRFRREVDVTSRLDHPGIVPVHAIDDGDDQRPPCYVMRFVEGQTLHQAIEQSASQSHSKPAARQSTAKAAVIETQPDIATPGNSPVLAPGRPLELTDLLQRFVTVCNIVAFAHSRGVIHRDIKPANILLGEFGETLLLDWGLAKFSGEQERSAQYTPDAPGVDHVAKIHVAPGRSGKTNSDTGHHAERVESIESVESSAFETQSGQLLGTPPFASPEQLLGRTAEIDERSDVYSLGATLFKILTGESVFQSVGIARHLEQIQTGRIPELARRLSRVHRVLAAICRKAIEIDPGNRYQSALTMARDVEAFLRDEPVSIPCESIRGRIIRRLRKHPRLTAAAFAGIVVSLMAAITGTFLLEQKNTQLATASEKLQDTNQALTASNADLQTAIDQAETNNLRAMKALKSLTEYAFPILERHRGVFTDQQEALLRKILAQYRESADIQGASPESRRIRATGLMNCGALTLNLGQHAEALTLLILAQKEFEALELIPDHGAVDSGLAEVLVLLAECHSRDGRQQESIDCREQAIQEFNRCLARTHDEATLDLQLRRIRTVNELIVAMGGLVAFRDADATRVVKLLDESQSSVSAILKKNDNNTETCLALLDSLAALDKLTLVPARQQELFRPKLVPHFQRVLSVCESILKREANQPRAQLHLANSLKSLAALQVDSAGDEKDSIGMLTQSVDLLTSLSTRFPDDASFRARLAASLAARSVAFRRSGDSARANEDDELFRTLSAGSSALWSYYNVPMYRQIQADYSAAQQRADAGQFRDAAAMFDDLATDIRALMKDRPGIVQPIFFSTILRRQADIQIQLRESAAAEKSLGEAIRLAAEDLPARESQGKSQYRRGVLMDMHTLRARQLRDLGRLDEAKSSLAEARDLFDRNQNDDQLSSSMLSRKAELLLELGFVESRRLDYQAAAQAFSEEIPVRRLQIAHRADDMNAKSRLGAAHCNLGNQLRMAGDFEASLPEFEAAIQLLTESLRSVSADSKSAEFLGTSHANYARSLFALNRHADACVQFDHAFKLQPKRRWGFSFLSSHAKCLLLEPDPRRGISLVVELCKTNELASLPDADRSTMAELCETAARLSASLDEQTELKTKAKEFQTSTALE